MANTDQSFARTTEAAAPLPRMAYVLTGCIAVIGSNSLGLGPIAPEVARSFGSTVPVVMTAAAAFGLGTAASALFLARHIDRIGARRMLQLALALLAVALILSALSPMVSVLIASQLIAGVASGVALPAIYSSAAAVAPPGRESRTIGVVLTGWTLSMVAGVSLSAVLADVLHWRAVFGAIAALAFAAVAMLSIGKYREVLATQSAPLPLEALRIAGAKPLLIACGAFMAAFYGMYGYLGDYLNNGLGQPVSANGLAAMVYGVGFGAAALLDNLVDRVGAKRVMPVAFVAACAVYVSMALLGKSFGALLVAVFVWGLANHFGLNVLIMRLTALDPSRRGTIMGLNSAVTYLAGFAGTAAFGPLHTSLGFAMSALVAAVLMLIAAIAAAWRHTEAVALELGGERSISTQ
ncbi:MFS transporter [Steroidobacter sp. S1-65]|uniref:MFS transporter n=1 Tax=Steroidobacter gossypii TaxID=2805490 RepID=A0ABS1WYB3_9GAMM|nr:MFS transporter [Steroidobacter gossypii]MBM0105966.1 MFS transporter [Steroidobacter gossypii]